MVSGSRSRTTGQHAAACQRARSTDSQPAPRLRGRARALALEIAAEARAEWAYTSDVIARAFRTHRELGSSERRLIAETVYGLVRWHRRLAAIVDELMRRRAASASRCRRRRRTSCCCWPTRRARAPIRRRSPAELRGCSRAPVRAGAPGRPRTRGWAAPRGLDREALRPVVPHLAARAVRRATWVEAEALALADALNRRAPLTVRVNTARRSIARRWSSGWRSEGVDRPPDAAVAGGADLRDAGSTPSGCRRSRRGCSR